MRTIVFVAPFPLEATMRFVRAAARLEGVRLVGVVCEEPRGDDARIFTDTVRVANALSAAELIRGIDVLRRRHGQPHRIVGVLEPLQVQLAIARDHFGVPGTDPNTADLFRDKARMKDRLRQAGLPVARHQLMTHVDEAESFAREVGFPIVLKPPAGLGAKATFRVKSLEELRAGIRGMGASPENPVLAEEFLHGTEGSFETITTGGRVRARSISHYLPPPLTVVENPWIQWCCMLPRDIDRPEYEEVARIGVKAIEALGLRDGFTHMEWFRRTDGSIAIGEIAQRPPGANITRMIGFATNTCAYRAWARSVIDGAFDAPWNRRYAVGSAFFRGIGRGRVAGVSGIEASQRAVGNWIVEAKIPTIGAPKSDSYEGDGYAIVRDERTSVVEQVLEKLIATVRVHYA
ncbi:MAG: ATP-grasp domain-containing protein [Myxococcales bacterium]|nr:ATP-grasp domain-containing protein [Myxococcales bacterium]